MKIFEKNRVENFERKLKTASLVLLVFLMTGTTARGQSIDDVLKPKPSVAKPKSTTKAPDKTTKKPVSRTVKKSYPRKVKPLKNPQTVAYTSETSDQILTRYMNFQQSAGVTERDWKSIIAQTAKILQDNPTHSVAKVQSFIAQGHIAYNQSNYSMAIIHFKAALKILPESSLPHYSLGKALLANGQAKAAEKSFEEATDQNKNFALAYKGIGDAAAAQGDKKKAEKYYKKATEISVKDRNMVP